MSNIEIAIGKSKYLIPCHESEQQNLIDAAARLNERVNKLSFSLRGVDEKTLLVIAALSVEMGSKVDPVNSEISERDVFDAVSESMENVATYLEKLIGKITK